MEAKKYVVGEFIDDTVECFPRIWLRGELEVLWPTGLSKKAVQHAIISLDKPREDWEVHQLRRVLAQSGSFKGAMKKASRAEFESNISETEPELEAKKRKVVRPERYLDGEVRDMRRVSSLSYDTDSDAGSYSRVAVPRFPSDEVEGTVEIVSASKGEAVSASKGEVNASKDEESLESIKVMFKAVMKEVQSLKYEVRSLKGQLLAQSWKDSTLGSEEDSICLSSILPVSNDEQMLTLCKGLEDMNSRKNLIHHLSLTGGITEAHMTRNIMKTILTNDMCKVYSCCGKNGKKNLSALAVYSVILNAVRKKFPEVSDADMRVKIGRYLTGAGDRNGGRKNRGGNSQNAV